jgi:hypothetical protein
LPERQTVSTTTGYNSNLDDWLSRASAIWRDGYGGGSTVSTDVPVTYTQEEHNAVLTGAGVSNSDSYSMSKLLKSWALTESYKHWGPNQRMILGGADEEGSIGFNQIVSKQRYSDAPCTVQKRAGLNYYHPEENLKGFVVQTASDRTLGKDDIGCGGGFWFAYQSDGHGMRRVYGDNTLTGYRHGVGAVHAVTTTNNKNQMCQKATRPAACEDSYDTLAKAIAFYNGETIVRNWPGNSWPEMLKKTVVTTIASQQGVSAGTGTLVYCFNCRYSILVREHFGLPKRTYIWKGADSGGSQDVNGDGTIADVPATETSPAVQETNRPDVPWCFAYGESEWVSGATYAQARQNASDTNADGAAQTPVGRVNCN